jgi:hypothetical protein
MRGSYGCEGPEEIESHEADRFVWLQDVSKDLCAAGSRQAPHTKQEKLSGTEMYGNPKYSGDERLSLLECSDQEDQILYEIGQVPRGNLLATALRLPILPGQFTFSMRIYV